MEVNTDEVRGGEDRCVIRMGHLWDSMETQGLFYIGEAGDLRVGAGFSYVHGEATEFHASGLYLRKNRKLKNRLLDGNSLIANSDPMVFRDRYDDYRFLLGLTYTWKNNISGTFEYWHDDSGYSEGEWQSLFQLSEQQQQLMVDGIFSRLAVDGNQLWSSQIFLQQNIMQDYLAVRFAKEVSGWDLSGYFVYSIPDSGWFFNAGLAGDVNDYHNVDMGFRIFGGKKDSVYENFPISSQVYISWMGVFSL